MTDCPCGTRLPFSACCNRYLSGATTAPTAVELMRSRYSAFATGNTEYLLRTWHPKTRPGSLVLDASQAWTRLEVMKARQGNLLDTSGVVEFTAHYEIGTSKGRLHETSSFERFDGAWVYVDGSVSQAE